MRKYLPHILIISFVLLCNFGCVSTPYGSKYVGENKDDKMHGQGTKTSPDGRKYVGESKDDKYSDSEYTYSNRKKYKELDEKKYPGINEKQRRMERAIKEGDGEALYKELFPGDLPIEYYGY